MEVSISRILWICVWVLPLILGIIAWALPLVYLTVWKRKALFCGASFACCAASILCQLWKIQRLTDLGHFDDLADIMDGMCLCATIRLAVTILFNAIILFEERKI